MKTRIVVLSIAVVLVCAVVLPIAAAPGKFAVTKTADKIVISGDKAKKTASDKFALSKDAWYVIKIKYSGPAVSICQLSLVNQKMIDDKATVGGMLTNWIGPKQTELIRAKGRFTTGDYMIYADETGGSFTVEILKSPKPASLSSAKTFSGTADAVTSFFKLKKGAANFTVNQKLKDRFSPRVEVNLYNATTGAFVANLCRNSTDAKLTSGADIPAAGTYVLEVRGGGAWDVSYSQ
ncbi:MAG: hypothetical protein JXD23_00015 [Spirochaetales bacterium]|nr:hypothetical protein [Spirochaetales bacterium]